MKRTILLFAMIISLASCSESEQTIVPTKEKIAGALGQYFKVVSREYKVIDGCVTIEIERTNDGFPDPWDEEMKVGWNDNCFEPGFTIEFTDEAGNVISKKKTEIVKNLNDLNSIASLSVGESASLSFRVNDDTISGFKVTSTFECHEPKQTSAQGTSTESGSSVRSIMNEVSDEYSRALNEVAGEYSRALNEVAGEYSRALDEVQKEVKDAYNESASEIVDAMKDIYGGLF